MTYRIAYSEEALSPLKKLDNKAALRILDKLDDSLADPARFFERLRGREEYKVRIGDYRVLARLMAGEKTVFILSPGHRKNVYKRRIISAPASQ